MAEFRWHVFLIVLLPSLVVLFVGLKRLQTPVQRMFYGFSVAALCWYSGVGAAYETVTTTYLLAYLMFLVAFAGTFLVTISGTRSLAARWQAKTAAGVTALIQNPAFVRWTIVLYLLVAAFPLLYPTFQLQRLVAPPPPDLSAAFEERFNDIDDPPLSRAMNYVLLLSSPFYLVALYHWRKRFVPLALGFFVPMYFEYCAKAYVGRGAVATSLAVCCLAIWQANRQARKYLVTAGLIAFPFVCIAMFEYKSLRLGGTALGVGWYEAAETLVRTETSFPLDSTTIIQSRDRVDLKAYFRWLATLPIPKVLTGEINGARVNYEISEILLNKEITARGSYVRLTGLVTESIYIFGTKGYWLHAVFLGLLMGLWCRVQESSREFLLLTMFSVILFSYFVCRGGVSTLMPRLVNANLLFLAWLAWLYVRPRVRRPVWQDAGRFQRTGAFGNRASRMPGAGLPVESSQ